MTFLATTLVPMQFIQITFGQMAFAQMKFYKMTFGQMAWFKRHFFKQHFAQEHLSNWYKEKDHIIIHILVLLKINNCRTNGIRPSVVRPKAADLIFCLIDIHQCFILKFAR